MIYLHDPIDIKIASVLNRVTMMLWLGNAFWSLLDSPHKGSTARSLDVFSSVSLDKLLNKHACCRRFETPWRSSDVIVVVSELIHSLWPNNAICRHRYGSTLAQVMDCCLAEPSHYLNQCGLIIKGVCGIHLRASLQDAFMNIIRNMCSKITHYTSPRGWWVNVCFFRGGPDGPFTGCGQTTDVCEWYGGKGPGIRV